MIRLTPMSSDAFERWYENVIREFAEDKVLSGDWLPENSLQLSRESYEELLPDKLATKDQYLFSIQDQANDVGVIWFGLRPATPKPIAFVYEVMIYENYRRRGYGAKAMQALDEKVKELGLDKIVLHVFGHNDAALALYKKTGYEISDYTMVKKLS